MMTRTVKGHCFNSSTDYKNPSALALYDHRLSGTAKVLFAILCDYANSGHPLNYATLTRIKGWSYRAIRKALTDLRECGWIEDLGDDTVMVYFCEDFRKEVTENDGQK